MLDRAEIGPVQEPRGRGLPNAPLVGRAELRSFQTVAEVRYGALLRGRGDTRRRVMEAASGQIEIDHPGPDIIRTDGGLRAILSPNLDAHLSNPDEHQHQHQIHTTQGDDHR